MSVPLTINGAVFNYPVNFDTNWGIDATGWAQAVTSGMLQKAGGSFPLTADIDFGDSFGLISSYFTSDAANPATSGTVRLASADPGVAFRNNANSGNIFLTTDASDDLVWGSHFLLQNANSLKLQDSGNAHTISVHSPSVATNYSITLPPNAGSAGQFLSTDGFGTTTWVNASGAGTINSGTTGQIAYYAASGTTISGAPFLSYAAPILTFQPGSSDAQFKIIGGNSNSAKLYMRASTFDNQFTSDTSGNLILQDLDNVINVWEYNRGVPSFVMGVPLDANNHSIINLPLAVNPGDAISFGQVQYGFQTAQYLTNFTSTASTSSTVYGPTGLNINITPTSATSRVKITVSINSLSTSTAGSAGHVTLFRNGSDLSSSATGYVSVSSSVSNTLVVPASFTVIDSPATTSPVNYSVQFKINAGGTFVFNQQGGVCSMIAEELR